MTETEKLLQATIKRQRDALQNIAGYPLPTFQIDGRGSMVPLENADYLRTLAKDALQPED